MIKIVYPSDQFIENQEYNAQQLTALPHASPVKKSTVAVSLSMSPARASNEIENEKHSSPSNPENGAKIVPLSVRKAASVQSLNPDLMKLLEEIEIKEIKDKALNFLNLGQYDEFIYYISDLIEDPKVGRVVQLILDKKIPHLYTLLLLLELSGVFKLRNKEDAKRLAPDGPGFYLACLATEDTISEFTRSEYWDSDDIQAARLSVMLKSASTSMKLTRMGDFDALAEEIKKGNASFILGAKEIFTKIDGKTVCVLHAFIMATYKFILKDESVKHYFFYGNRGAPILIDRLDMPQPEVVFSGLQIFETHPSSFHDLSGEVIRNQLNGVDPFHMVSFEDENEDELESPHLIMLIDQFPQKDRGNCTMIAPKMGIDFIMACAVAQEMDVSFSEMSDEVYEKFIQQWEDLSNDFSMLQRAQILCKWANCDSELMKSEYANKLSRLAAEEFCRLAEKKLSKQEGQKFNFNVLKLNVFDFLQKNFENTSSADVIRSVIEEKTGKKIQAPSLLGKRSSIGVVSEDSFEKRCK
jgi:hypothetical protein